MTPDVPLRSSKLKKLRPLQVCFHSNQAGERGTEVALYDYAHFNEVLLHHKSWIIFPDIETVRNGPSLQKFQKRFNVTTYTVSPNCPISGGPELTRTAKKVGCDFLYVIKGGQMLSEPIFPTCVTSDHVHVGFHAVFAWEPHGSSYAAISRDVTQSQVGRAVVPHMVSQPNVPSNLSKSQVGLRQRFGIPPTALVLCRHGGRMTFDVPFVHDKIWQLISDYNETTLHFMFMGTNHFSSQNCSRDKNSITVDVPVDSHIHKQLHFIPTVIDMIEKELFFQTCDAMIHARLSGETFGLAVAEFSVRNLPVITYPGVSREHIRILGDRAYVYNDADELDVIIRGMISRGVPSRDYNAYKDFSPESVMRRFQVHFLDPVFSSEA